MIGLPLKYLFITVALFTLSGCAIYNPFIPPSGSLPEYEEPITACEPISTDPMYRATMKPYTVMGKRYCPTVVKVGDTFKGVASWYGNDFHGKQTSNGEYYNMHDYTAAHKTLPINTLVKVTNLRNNQSTTVRINDRGPFVDNRIIDLSYQAAVDIDMIKKGTAPVLLEVVEFDESASKYAHKQPVEKVEKKPIKSVWKRYDPHEFDTEVTETKPDQNKKVIAGGDYSIQIASLSSKQRAVSLKEKCYNGAGNYNPHIKEKIYNGQTIYKVMLGGFKSIKEAKDFIKREHYKGAFVIRN
jgi:rare lipoprotein A